MSQVNSRPSPEDITLLTLAAVGVSTVNSSDQANVNYKGIQLGINITAISATLTVTIQGKDASGTYYTLLASTGLVGTGFTLMTVYPGAPTTANASVPQVLPHVWRVTAAITVSGTATATISASLIP